MEWFKFQEEKTIEAIRLVIKGYGESIKFHKLFKILYFADQKHLAKYARPITGDVYTAMKNGPVPSAVYDIMKNLKDPESVFPINVESFKSYFKVKEHVISSLIPDVETENLSESEKDCLRESFLECRNLNFAELSLKSHDTAWDAADKNNLMSGIKIAQSGGANEDMIEYLRINIENDNLVF